MSFLIVTLGSALGGLMRYALTRWTMTLSAHFPWGTLVVNLIGCWIIGFFGTLTLANGRLTVSENTRLFVMVGVCGGFTTFSSFSLQTFDFARSGAWNNALLNVILSVVVCFLAVGAGYRMARHPLGHAPITVTREEKTCG